jgi:ABC-type transporter Mla subunit MlaD
MNMRRREPGLLGNSVLIGALTLLATIVAVTLAFQANNGLPFVPRYTLRVQVRNAEELTHGAEVHMGGALVGAVDRVEAARDRSGRPIAVLDMKLNKNVQPLPVDTRFTIRLKGAIGLKYLDVSLGHAARSWHDGATVPIGLTGTEVDLDQVLSMFNPPTRTGVVASTTGFSDALAGRGATINDAIGAFVPLVTDLGPVMRNLSSRQTDLGGFLRGLGSFTNALVPVAQDQADLYGNLDTTFAAFARVAYPYLQNWISDTPPAFSAVIADSPREQAFASDTAALFADLRPGFATLPTSAPILADAFAAGARNLPGTVRLDRRTTSLARTLARFGGNPVVSGGLDRITLTVRSLISPLRFLTPAQATCNYVTLFLRNIASSLGEQVGTGTALRFNLVVIDDVPGAESVASSRPFLTPDLSHQDEHGPLHVNAYPNTDAPGQTAECAAGNEPYSGAHGLIGNPPGNLGLHTETTKRPGS